MRATRYDEPELGEGDLVGPQTCIVGEYHGYIFDHRRVSRGLEREIKRVAGLTKQAHEPADSLADEQANEIGLLAEVVMRSWAKVPPKLWAEMLAYVRRGIQANHRRSRSEDAAAWASPGFYEARVQVLGELLARMQQYQRML